MRFLKLFGLVCVVITLVAAVFVLTHIYFVVHLPWWSPLVVLMTIFGGILFLLARKG